MWGKSVSSLFHNRFPGRPVASSGGAPSWVLPSSSHVILNVPSYCLPPRREREAGRDAGPGRKMPAPPGMLRSARGAKTLLPAGPGRGTAEG